MLRNFKFDTSAKTDEDRLQQDNIENSHTEESKILEENIYEYEGAEPENVLPIEESFEDKDTLSEENTSILPAKLPGPLGFIDEDTILLIVLFILLQSPKKDLSLMLILLLVFINK